jgi:hypothetical protein
MPEKGDPMMPLIFYLALINWMARLGAAVVRKRREPKPAPLCATCTFAHMQYAVSGKRAISCTFGGGLRLMAIDVMYCTDYRDRNIPEKVSVVGFVRQLPEREAAVEVAAAGR